MLDGHVVRGTPAGRYTERELFLASDRPRYRANRRAGTGNYGFDAARGVYGDLVEAGIIDPTKVVRLALENAVSVASVLPLSEATLTELPEPKPERAAPEEF